MLLLLAGHSTACRTFSCLPGVLLLAGHSTACRAFYCLPGVLLLAGHSTACRTFYCLRGILLLAGRSTACRAFYCLLGILLLLHTHTPCTCRCTGSTAVASLTANSSVCQRFLHCFVPLLPRQQLVIIEGSNDEDGINSSPENGRTFARHDNLTNTSTACWAFFSLLGILLLVGHSTAFRTFYCLSGVLLHAGRSTACRAL